MGKPSSLAIVLLGLACLLLICCQTAGTPRQSDGPATKSRVAAARSQTPPPADPATKKRAASYSGPARSAARSTASVQPKVPKSKRVNRLAGFSKAVLGQTKPVRSLRALLYAALALILLVVIGAIAAERAGKRRKLSPSPIPARR
jgi:hypothetical protein